MKISKEYILKNFIYLIYNDFNYIKSLCFNLYLLTRIPSCYPVPTKVRFNHKLFQEADKLNIIRAVSNPLYKYRYGLILLIGIIGAVF